MAGNEVWSQGGEGVAGAPEAGDQFGYSLAAGNFGNSSHADLAIGVPFEDQAATNDGAVNVIYGGPGGSRCRATRCGARAARASPGSLRRATSSERPSRLDGPDLGGEGRRPAPGGVLRRALGCESSSTWESPVGGHEPRATARPALDLHGREHHGPPHRLRHRPGRPSGHRAARPPGSRSRRRGQVRSGHLPRRSGRGRGCRRSIVHEERVLRRRSRLLLPQRE